MGEAGRAGHSLRHDERGRAVADRHHGQGRRRRLGPVPQGIAVRRTPPARRQRSHHRSEPSRRARADRRGDAAGPRAGRRDDPVLASRAVDDRHRARACAAGEGEARVDRADVALCLTMLTSFRMYNAVPRAAQAWRALFERVFAETKVGIQIVDHGWPVPIDSLWRETELCCAFMCGWPFVRSGRMQAIAAPVPSPQRYEGLPRYCSEFLVRADSGFRSLEDTFGHRFGWMAADSQSGFNAPRAHLARFVSPHRSALYAEVCGPLGTPMKALEALRAGEVDVTALDSFFLDLCRYHEPAKLDGMRSVA